MKDLAKFTALLGLNVILALTGAPRNAQAQEDPPEVCYECTEWYAHNCGVSGGGDAHTFDHDPPQCSGYSSPRGNFNADHATVYSGSCDEFHLACNPN